MPVNFVQTTLEMKANDKDETVYEVTMDIGWIAKEYQNADYFDFYKENMLGISPVRTEGLEQSLADQIMARQFLYQFTQEGKQKGLGYLESYAFDGGSNFIVGGNTEDYEALVCNENETAGGVENNGVVKENAMPVGKNDQVFTDAMYYKGTDFMLKINGYVPPIKEELDETILALDSWNRETQLPEFFYNYFVDTFMVTAYTCDKLNAPEKQYPGMSATYSCYCNNGDYHTMPDINLEIRNKDF